MNGFDFFNELFDFSSKDDAIKKIKSFFVEVEQIAQKVKNDLSLKIDTAQTEKDLRAVQKELKTLEKLVANLKVVQIEFNTISQKGFENLAQSASNASKKTTQANKAVAGSYNAIKEELEKLKKEIKNTPREINGGLNPAFSDLEKQIAKTEFELKNLEQSQKKASKTFADSVQNTNLASDSIKAIRLEISKLNEELVTLSPNDSRFNQLGEQLRTLRDRERELSQGLGDFRSTVGSYRQEVNKALTDFFSGQGSLDNVASAFGSIPPQAAAALAAVVAFTAGLEKLVSISKEYNAISNKTASALNLQGTALEVTAAKASALAKSLELDFDKIITAINSGQVNFGQTSTKVLNDLTTALVVTGVKQDELLEGFAEYSTNFKKLGLTAQQSLGFLSQGFKIGAFNADVLGDNLNNAAIELARLTAKDLAPFFKGGAKEAQGLLDQFKKGQGADVLQAIANRVLELGERSQKASELITKVFTAVGEERIGTGFFTALANIKTANEELTKSLTERQKAQIKEIENLARVEQEYIKLTENSKQLTSEYKLLKTTLELELISSLIEVVKYVQNLSDAGKALDSELNVLSGTFDNKFTVGIKVATAPLRILVTLFASLYDKASELGGFLNSEFKKGFGVVEKGTEFFEKFKNEVNDFSADKVDEEFFKIRTEIDKTEKAIAQKQTSIFGSVFSALFPDSDKAKLDELQKKEQILITRLEDLSATAKKVTTSNNDAIKKTNELTQEQIDEIKKLRDAEKIRIEGRIEANNLLLQNDELFVNARISLLEKNAKEERTLALLEYQNAIADLNLTNNDKLIAQTQYSEKIKSIDRQLAFDKVQLQKENNAELLQLQIDLSESQLALLEKQYQNEKADNDVRLSARQKAFEIEKQLIEDRKKQSIEAAKANGLTAEELQKIENEQALALENLTDSYNEFFKSLQGPEIDIFAQKFEKLTKEIEKSISEIDLLEAAKVLDPIEAEKVRFELRQKNLKQELHLLEQQKAAIELNIANEAMNNRDATDLIKQRESIETKVIQKRTELLKNENEKETENIKKVGELSSQLATTIQSALEKRFELQTKQNDLELERQNRLFESELRLAELGKDVDLAKRQEQINAAIEQQIKLEKQKLNTQIVFATLETYLSEIKNGKNATQALQSAVLQAVLFKTLGSGYEKGGFVNKNGFSEGFTGMIGTKEIAGFVHGKEYVIPADITLKTLPFLQSLHKTGDVHKAYHSTYSQPVIVHNDYPSDKLMKAIENISITNIAVDTLGNFVETMKKGNSISQNVYLKTKIIPKHFL